ncbi:MAG: T9SS type A sorting domain-containing protein [Bacteroidales bacterium]|nr:T9SS type A sorting domain-containing protein [Bacteroidales bacterium]
MKNRLLICSVILTIFFLPAAGQVHHSCPLHPERDYENPLYEEWLSGYDVKFYHISLEADNRSTQIDGFTTVTAEALALLDTFVLELQDSLTVTRVTVDSLYNAPFGHAAGVLTIPLQAPKQPGEAISVTVWYGGEAGQNRGFFAGISSARDTKYNAEVTYTLSEPFNAKDWFPVKQVLKDKCDSAWIDITCDRSLMAASNGILETVEPLGSGRHRFKWKTRFPTAYYLLSFTVADYIDYSFRVPLPGTEDSVLVQNFIYDNPAVLTDWEENILQTGELIRLFSTLLIDYPFAAEKYGHAMAPMGGGMEHQTMTTLTNFSFTLVAHELAHQWFGDYVTCGNWQDIWINEGFASYMEYVALENLVGKDPATVWMDQAMSLALSDKERSVFVPAGETDNPSRLFNLSLSYKKGAVLLHMIRYEINNDELFFRALGTYLERFANREATAEAFREVLEEVTAMDFSCFFDQWYYGSGYPSFSVSWYQEADSLYIFSSQTGTSENTPFFRTHFDLLLKGTGGEYPVRLYQSDNENIFVIAVPEMIGDIEFDPGRNLLCSSSVRQEIPENRLYVFGPNPFTGKINIRFRNHTGNKKLIITSLDGREVRRYELYQNPVWLDLTELQDGPYLMVIRDDENRIIEKIIKVSD